MCIIRHWPTAAAACFIRREEGRSESPMRATPTAMAPEVTRMTSCPAPHRSLSTRTSRSMLLRSRLPEECVRVEVPTLTTMRFPFIISVPQSFLSVSIVKYNRFQAKRE